ncbi:MAG: diguanylate cyclase [Rhodospirillaceae bacterium]|jgi:diguanylate cyclase (GGDEF)-like protein|nr:diguanylate cyclase [Rhodospirillaceae bacterium]
MSFVTARDNRQRVEADEPLAAANGIDDVPALAFDLDRPEMQARLARLAIMDELTGAFNRRYFLAQAPVELQRAIRYHRPLSFMFMDIDRFKQVNDRFGHSSGDQVLISFTSLCRQGLRPYDLFVRQGGDEFVVMLPETDLYQAAAVAGRLAETIRNAVFAVDPPIQGLTVSIGVSALCSPAETLDAIVKRADEQLYRAKNGGRDRIEFQPNIKS